MTLTAGTRLGVYEVTAQIGEGGMGQVFRATDTKLKRQVAIKILPPALGDDADRLARFQREAEVLASLNHPNVAAIYGIEESHDVRAIVMEFVEGDDLSQRIARGAIPLEEALSIAKQIAGALDAAHEQGIIHRDLKPANIKVRDDGTVKVLDFGLAKALAGHVGGSTSGDAALANSPTLTSPAMTQMGVILGTAAYMSPEQARGHAADKRSDVWAFGCVLFEMLTGRRAFEGADASDTLAAILRGQPDWNTFPPDVPAQVRTIVARCLEKDRRERVPDVAVVRFLLDSPPVAVQEGPDARRSRLALSSMLGAALAGGLVLGLGGAWLTRGSSSADTLTFSILYPQGTFLPTEARALSPDGRMLAEVRRGAQGPGLQIWLRRMDRVDWTPIRGTEGASPSVIFWSPDSRQLGFHAVAERKLKRVDVVGGVPQTICAAGVGAPIGGATWSTDGTIVFVDSRDPGSPIRKVSASGGEPLVVELAAAPGEISRLWPSFLPDGRHFLYLSLAGEGKPTEIRVASVDGGPSSSVATADSMALYAPASKHLLFVRGSTLVAQRFDPRTFRLSGDPARVGEGVGVTQFGQGNFSASATGVLAHWSGANSDTRLIWRSRSGGEIEVSPSPDFYRGFDLSPDDRYALVHIHEPRSAGGNLWLVDVARKSQSRFNNAEPRHDVAPIWSADGTRAVFSSSDAASAGLYVKDLKADSRPTLLLKLSASNAIARSWSADGRFILVEQRPGSENSDLAVLPVAEPDRPVAVADSPFNEQFGDFSPNARWIAYNSDESGRPEIYIQSFPGRDVRVKVTVDGGFEPRWSSDGATLYFISLDSRLMSVPVTLSERLEIGTAAALFPILNRGYDSTNRYRVSRDGQKFLIFSATGLETPTTTVAVNWAAALK